MAAVPIPTAEAPVVPTEEEAVPDAEAVVEEEAAPAEEEGAEEPKPDADQELLDAIDALGDDDPLKKRLQEKFAPPDVGEERLQWDTEKDRTERQGRVQGAFRYAAQYRSEDAFNRAYAGALQETAGWQEELQALAQQIADGDYDPKNGVFSAEAAAQSVAALAVRLAQEAMPAEGARVATRIEDTLLTSIEASPIYKHFTTDDRKALKAASRIQLVDYRIAAITAVALEVAIRGGPKVREQRTKAETEQEKTKAEARQKLLATLGTRGAVTQNGQRSPGNEQDRLDRLSMGQDRRGNKATQADRDWFAQKYPG